MARRPADEDDILDFQPEVYDDPPESDDIRGSTGQAPLLLSIALGLAMIVAILVTGWYFLADSQGTPGGEGGVPIVQADPAPIKVKPSDPGGMEVPNQDKLVYELGRNEAPAQGERLLPGPETPQPPPILATPKPETTEPAPAPKTDPTAPPAPSAAAQPAVVTAALPTEPVKPDAGKTDSKLAVKPEPKPEIKPAEVKPTETKPAETKTAAATAPAKLGKGSWQIQVAALRDAESAQREWASLSSTHKDLLGTLSSDVVRADLGAKGIFYRLRAGPLDEVSARKLCDELVKRKIGCLVVRK